MADISSLYPQPPAPAQANALAGNPLQLLSQINALRQFQAKTAQGAAAQNALNPDGTLDFQKYSAGLQDPAAAYGAQEAIGTLQEQRGRQIQNSSAQLGLGVANNQAASSIIASLAQKKNPTMEDIYNAQAAMARAGIDPAVISSWGAGTNPSNIKGRISDAANFVMGPAAAATRVTGPVDASGAPTQQSLGSNLNPGTQATSLPPQLAQTAQQATDALNTDQQAASTRMAGIRPLQNALPLVEQLSHADFGPGSDKFAQFKRTLQTAGIIGADSKAADVNSLREEAGKYMANAVLAAPGSERSDAGLLQAAKSRPGLEFTQAANLNLIKNEIGQARMDATMPHSFVSDNPDYTTNPATASRYLAHKNNYYQNNDPRAFSFDLMSPEDRRKVVDSLGSKDSAAYKKFARSYQLAKQAGMIAPQAPNGQQ